MRAPSGSFQKHGSLSWPMVLSLYKDPVILLLFLSSSLQWIRCCAMYWNSWPPLISLAIRFLSDPFAGESSCGHRGRPAPTLQGPPLGLVMQSSPSFEVCPRCLQHLLPAWCSLKFLACSAAHLRREACGPRLPLALLQLKSLSSF